MGEEHVDALLVLSQVILSLQLGFAVIPLIHFVSDKTTMGEFVIHWKVKLMAWIVASILVFLNGNLVVGFVISFYNGTGNGFVKLLLILLVLLFFALLIYIIVFPIFLKRHHAKVEEGFHGEMIELDWSQEAPVNKIAIAVDFSVADARLIKTAIQHAHEATEFIFIHVVESATAKYLQDASDDIETRKDQARLDTYANALVLKGYKATTYLGYENRVKEIVNIVNSYEAKLLVMGGHRHQGWKDYIFGETIESVRHKVNIPVLIVNI
jgi:manganese transport protein